MSKEEILQTLLDARAAYEEDWKNPEKWAAYDAAWRAWRAVKGND